MNEKQASFELINIMPNAWSSNFDCFQQYRSSKFMFLVSLSFVLWLIKRLDKFAHFQDSIKIVFEIWMIIGTRIFSHIFSIPFICSMHVK